MKPVNLKGHKGKFFDILQETKLSQIGVMSLKPGQNSGLGGSHAGDQIVYVIEGKAEVTMIDEKFKLTEGMAITIPKDTDHSLANSSDKDLLVLSVYAPPVY